MSTGAEKGSKEVSDAFELRGDFYFAFGNVIESGNIQTFNFEFDSVFGKDGTNEDSISLRTRDCSSV